MNIQITRLPHGRDLTLPYYGTKGSSGADLCAALDASLCLAPGERALIPTGIKIALSEGLEGQIRSRSGLSLKHGLTVLNSPATIDSDYRGELKVILINLGQQDFTIDRGLRIAQLVIAPFIQVTWQEVPQLTHSTERQESGFGSTGFYAIGSKK